MREGDTGMGAGIGPARILAVLLIVVAGLCALVSVREATSDGPDFVPAGAAESMDPAFPEEERQVESLIDALWGDLYAFRTEEAARTLAEAVARSSRLGPQSRARAWLRDCQRYLERMTSTGRPDDQGQAMLRSQAAHRHAAAAGLVPGRPIEPGRKDQAAAVAELLAAEHERAYLLSSQGDRDGALAIAEDGLDWAESLGLSTWLWLDEVRRAGTWQAARDFQPVSVFSGPAGMLAALGGQDRELAARRHLIARAEAQGATDPVAVLLAAKARRRLAVDGLMGNGPEPAGCLAEIEAALAGLRALRAAPGRAVPAAATGAADLDRILDLEILAARTDLAQILLDTGAGGPKAAARAAGELAGVVRDLPAVPCDWETVARGPAGWSALAYSDLSPAYSFATGLMASHGLAELAGRALEAAARHLEPCGAPGRLALAGIVAAVCGAHGAGAFPGREARIEAARRDLAAILAGPDRPAPFPGERASGLHAACRELLRELGPAPGPAPAPTREGDQ